MQLDRGGCLCGVLPLSQRLHSTPDHPDVNICDFPDDCDCCWQHAGDYSHRYREEPQELTELVHRQPRCQWLVPRPHHYAIFLGQRVDGILDIWWDLVWYSLRYRCTSVYGFHNEHLSDQLGPLLVHNACHRLSKEKDSHEDRPDDMLCVDTQCSDINSSIAWMEGGTAVRRTISTMFGKFGTRLLPHIVHTFITHIYIWHI